MLSFGSLDFEEFVGAGRPKLAKGKAKGVLITWRVTPAEADLIRLAMKKCGVKKRSVWLRDVIIQTAEMFLYN